MDGVHDLLRRLGDLTEDELRARCVSSEVAGQVEQLVQQRRVLRIRLASQSRYIAVEDSARYRDAFGVALPPGLPDIWLEKSADALLSIVRRFARTHGPFTTADVAARYAIEAPRIELLLRALHGEGKLLEGEFRPSGTHQEWCDPEVLRRIRRKTLARLRREIEPVEPRVLGRLLTRWQGVAIPRRGPDALLDAIGILQGAPLPASELEREILAARVANYSASDLDTLMAAGEVVWVGVERIGDRDGRVALYLSENLSMLLPAQAPNLDPLSERARLVLQVLESRGASFFAELHTTSGGGFGGETLDALWELVWTGLVTNDSVHPLRAFLRPAKERQGRALPSDGPPGSVDFLHRFRSRMGQGTPSQGRWSLVRRGTASTSTTEWIANTAQQLLVRYGLVAREAAVAENIPGGYSAIYPALRTMEESGWIRRGMFVAEMGAMQFAMSSAVEMLRTLRVDPDNAEAVHLASTDPANPYGALLPWPRSNGEDSTTPHSMARVSGASVVLVNGRLAAFLRRRNPVLRVFLPEDEPERTQVARALASKLAEVAVKRQSRKGGLLVGEINDSPAREHFLGRFLLDAGFVETALGFQMRRITAVAPVVGETDPDPDDDNADTV